ncbi:MAG: FxsA family protein [Pseudomonadota bacterium]
MRFFLFLAFVVVPIVEIAVFLQVGSYIGVPATLGLIILTAIAGTMLVRSQGIDVIRKVQDSTNRGEMPVAALAQGLFVLIAGVLLLTPGFATDTLGFALLIPPVRELIGAKLWKLIEPNVVTSTQWSSTHTRGNPNRPGGTVIDIEAVEIDETAGNGAEKPGNTRRNQ